jgi:tRNA(adenine34) deaminase
MKQSCFLHIHVLECCPTVYQISDLMGNRHMRPEESQIQTYMQEALLEAKKAFEMDEVPVGAVLVHRGEIIARAHNQVERLGDASAHAEMLCLRLGAQHLGNWRLLETTLYCTLEPCAMCAGAMILARLPALVWGAPDLRHGANGSWTNLFPHHPIHQVAVQSGVLQEECSTLMTAFFQKKREEKKCTSCSKN